MLIGIVKIIFYALLVYLIYMTVRLFQSLTRKKPPSKSPKSSSGIMVKDETCNTYLPKEDAVKEIFQGKEYFFCSEECRQKFLSEKKKK